jgi:Tfp pilus assembly protein PilV
MQRGRRNRRGFALYEVLIGLTIFVVGIVSLGRSVQNCLNATALASQEDEVRRILSNRMAEIQATPGIPDERKETKVDTSYGPVNLIQKTGSADLKDEDTTLTGINLVTLSAEWTRHGFRQTKKIEFYVYRNS